MNIKAIPVVREGDFSRQEQTQERIRSKPWATPRSPAALLLHLRSRDAISPESLGQINDWLDQRLTLEIAESVNGEQDFEIAVAVLKSQVEPILKHKSLLLCYQLLRLMPQALSARELRPLVLGLLAQPGISIWETVGAILVTTALESEEISHDRLGLVLANSLVQEDGFFLRANILEHTKKDLRLYRLLYPYLYNLLHDPSPYVRIRGVEVLRCRSEHSLLVGRLERGDDHPQVQAALWLLFADVLFQKDFPWQARLFATFSSLFQQIESSARLSFLNQLNQNLAERLVAEELPSPENLDHLQEMIRLMRQAGDDSLMRLSSLSLRYLELMARPDLLQLYAQNKTWLTSPEPLRPVTITASIAEADLGCVLSVLAFSSWGFEVSRQKAGWLVSQGHRFSFSLWRAVHEVRHLSSGKRQGAPHWISRDLKGSIRIPSSILCELVETQVPGEPLWIAEAGGWRPWLPLLCDIYRMIFRHPFFKIYTPDGLTVVERPLSWRGRVKAWTTLTLSFSAMARLRNWNVRLGGKPDSYIRALRELGFKIRFEPRSSAEKTDASIARFFGEAL